jgi:hypothetical protein
MGASSDAALEECCESFEELYHSLSNRFRADSRIDLSDIPEIKRLPCDAMFGKFCRLRKTSIMIRLEAADLGIILAAEEIDENRREMWKNFPRGF